MSQSIHTKHYAGICDPALLQKYNVSGPRYTSYPTAAQFIPTVDATNFRSITSDRSQDGPLSLYFHLPFCESICYYCACNKIVTRDRSRSATYVQYLIKEMALLENQLEWHRRPVSQLHWGGGTPTFLSDDEMKALMGKTRETFNLVAASEAEYSIEIDPRTIDERRLKLLWNLGFNRISLGIQDFDEDVQRAVNRIQSYESIRQQVDHCRNVGFKSINFDLIYGLPLQTENTVQQTIDKVISLAPDRISCYNYAHLPERFKSQRSIDRQRLPGPEEKIGLITRVISRLTDAGYVYLGMDHFVKPDDALAKALREDRLQRNFQGYSLDLAEDMLSLGVSSISDFANAYTQNYRQLEDYYRALDAGNLPVEQSILLSKEDKVRRDIIQQITCHRHLDTRVIEGKYQLNFDACFSESLARLAPLEKDGIVERDGPVIRVTAAGSLFLRHVAMAFDQYLGLDNPANASYSKAI